MSFNGQFAGGTVGAVRAPTEPNFREQNKAFQEGTRLTKVVVAKGQPIAPAWSSQSNLLPELPGLP